MRGRLLGVLALAALLLAAVLAVLVWSIVDYRTAARDTSAHVGSIARAARLERLVIDLETGQRGFVISGDEGFLEPWRSARSILPGALRAFESAEAEHGHGQKARSIVDAIRAYLSEYSEPVVAEARRDRAAAARTVSRGEGRRRVDAIRARFAGLTAAEQGMVDDLRREADRLGAVALAVGIAGLASAMTLLLLCYAYLSRALVGPVRRVAGATERLASGDLSARVPGAQRTDELGRLASSFNAMADSLEENREELEAQNAELEAQQGELSRAVGELARERDLVVALNRFAARLAGEVEVEALSVALLDELAVVGRAEVGTVYVTGTDEHSGLRLASSRGLHPEQLPRELSAGDGLAGRAAAERAPAVASYREADPALSTWGADVTVCHELHLPLVQAERVLGVVSLGRVDDVPFARGQRDVLASMAGQGAVALSNALALRQARRDAAVTRSVLDATPDGIALTDLDGDVVLANPPMLALQTIVGFGSEGPVHERMLAGADRMTDPDGFREDVAEVAGDPEGLFRQEYTVAESGRSFLRYVAPVRDSADALIGRIFVVRETTAERQAERMKDELVATVSHELRTPLTSIIGYIELVLGEENGLAEQHRGFLNVVDRNARRLLAVVGDLLFVAQVETGKLPLEPGLFDVSALVDDAAQAARPLAAVQELTLEVEVEPGLRAWGDRRRLAQLLANLVSNAIKFTPSGGRVTIRAHFDGETLVLEVADTGLGIPQAEQASIFQRFFRASTASRNAIEGTGLGLVICKAIAEAHDGSISFTSTPAMGTTFRVELPFAARTGREVNAA